MKVSLDLKENGTGNNSHADENSGGSSGTSAASPVNEPPVVDSHEDLDREIRNKDPLWYCQLIVNYPKILFGVALFGHIFFAGMNGILAAAGYDIFPFEFLRIPLNLNQEDVRLRDWAWQHSKSSYFMIRRTTLEDTQNKSVVRGVDVDPFQIFYADNGNNIFTKEHLRSIWKIEWHAFNFAEYQLKYCQLKSDLSCVLPQSLMRYFDGTYRHVNPVFYDPDFNNITGVIWEANTNPATKENFQMHLGKESRISKDSVFTEVTRSNFAMGYPLLSEKSYEGQLQEIGDFLYTKMAPKLEEMKHIPSISGSLDYCYISFRLFLSTSPVTAFNDMKLAFGSIFFIFCFIWLQTGTLWVTSWAVLSIIASLFEANLFYRIILDYRYFGYFHIISIFIILGIGADDIFVFHNTWKATSFHEYPTLAHRLSDCFRRAASTMFVTSLTTMAAFLVSGLSPLLIIKSFGVYSGILVAVNYISVVIFFPTVVIVHHIYFEKCELPIEKCKKVKNVETTEENQEKRKQSIIIRFLKGPFFKFVSHRVAKWCILLVFLIMIGFLSWSTSTLTSDSEQIQIFKSTNNIGKAWKLFMTAFKPIGLSFIPVNIVWGLKNQNISSCHFSDDKCRGSTLWDEKFDLSKPNVQLALKDFCHNLKYGLTSEEKASLQIRNDPTTGELQVDCFMDQLETFLKVEENRLRQKNITLDLSLPLTERKMLSFMQALDPYLYNVTALPRDFYGYFETALAYWLSNRYTMQATPDFYRFTDFIGDAWEDPYTRLVNNPIAPQWPKKFGQEYGTRLRFAAVRVNLSVGFLGLSYTDGIPLYDAWENFTNVQMAKLPHQLQGGFQCNVNMWHWLKVQESLVRNAINGIVLGVCLALPVLIIATSNFIIGFIATLVICFITVCVTGVIPLVGWKLGVLVSMNLCLVVGLSVDYVVHMAEGYHLSTKADRLGRVQDMLESVGVSVLAGGVTTLGASFFMFFGQIQFFLQFGAFLFTTIGFSLLFSLGFFSTAMAIVGPQEENGSFKQLFMFLKIIYRKCKKAPQGDENGNNQNSDHTMANALALSSSRQHVNWEGRTDTLQGLDNPVYSMDHLCEPYTNKESLSTHM